MVNMVVPGVVRAFLGLVAAVTAVCAQYDFYRPPGPSFYGPRPGGFHDFGGYRPAGPYGNPGFSPAYPPSFGYHAPPPPPPPAPYRPVPAPPRRSGPTYRPRRGGRRRVVVDYHGDDHNDHSHGKHDSKILSRSFNQRVPGGFAAQGKFRTLHQCERACSGTATCFAADFDAHSKRCYLHGSTTACDTAVGDHYVTHVKKIACTAPSASANAAVSAGMFRPGGIHIVGVKSLLGCIKQCSKTAGGTGVGCFGLDFDMSAKKCFLHAVEANSCGAAAVALQAKEDVTHIDYCP